MYPSAPPPPPPPRNKGVWIALGVCGGCVALIVVIFVVIAMAGMAGIRAVKTEVGNLMQSTTTCETFLKSLQAHNYDVAENGFTLNEQQRLPASDLKKLAEGLEKDNGKLQSWKMTSSNINSNNGANTLQFTYSLQYVKGQGTAIFLFRRNVMQKGTSQIDEVEMQQGAPPSPSTASPNEPPGGNGSGSETDKTEKTDSEVTDKNGK